MTDDVTSLAAPRVAYQQQVSARLEARVLAAWGDLARGDLDAAWRRVAPRVKLALVFSQREAAQGAAEYVQRALDAQGVVGERVATLPASSLAGYAMDGRSLDGALMQPIIGVRNELSRGLDRADALDRGGRRMLRLVEGELGDTARTADGIAIGLESQAVGYVRRVNLPSCGRCIILAGKFFRRNEGFKRHPKCDCTHVPLARSWAAPSPDALIERMTPAQREAALGKSNAAAIAAGADPAQVINARRGMSSPNERFTTESTTKRGVFPGGRRETPAALLDRYGDEPEKLRDALRAYGYLS